MTRKTKRTFDAQAFLMSAGAGKRTVSYARADVIFSQGDPCDTVMYVRSGGIQLSVLSPAGKEAIVATLRPGDFLGEGALTGQPIRLVTARATMPCTLLAVSKRQMIHLLHRQHAMSDRFIAYMLVRNARVEADLVDQLFNQSERRLARTLLLLAGYGKGHQPLKLVPRVSQTMLAEMVGTTRPRVNFFLNKFKKLGFIEYNGGLIIHPSLLTIVVRE